MQVRDQRVGRCGSCRQSPWPARYL